MIEEVEIIKPNKKNLPSNFVTDYFKNPNESLESKIIKTTVIVLVVFVLIKFAINLF